MQIGLTNILIIIGISLSVALIAFILITARKKGKYDDERHSAILEEVRNSFENQIYALNDRLIQSEERWRDVNHLLLRKEYLEKEPAKYSSTRIHYSEFLKANGISENELVVNSRL